MGNYNTTIELLDLARRLGPEGEGLDVSDLDLSVEDLVEIKSIVGQLRTAGEVVNRALAQEWNDQYKGQAIDYGKDTYYLGYASKRIFKPGKDIEFAMWLKDQSAEEIRKIVSVNAIRVSPLGRPDSPLREKFFDEERTSDDLRIVSKPNKKGT